MESLETRCLLTASAVINADNHPALVGQQHTNAILDVITNRLWLDVTETLGLSYNQVKSKIDSGQEFEGWLLPQLSDMEQLLADASIPYPTSPPGNDLAFISGFNKTIPDFSDIYGSALSPSHLPLSIGWPLSQKTADLFWMLRLNGLAFYFAMELVADQRARQEQQALLDTNERLALGDRRLSDRLLEEQLLVNIRRAELRKRA